MFLPARILYKNSKNIAVRENNKEEQSFDEIISIHVATLEACSAHDTLRCRVESQKC